jgi:hypothetical protein
MVQTAVHVKSNFNIQNRLIVKHSIIGSSELHVVTLGSLAEASIKSH